MTDTRPPKDGIRAMPSGYQVRAAEDGGMPTLVGHFSVFNQWTRISSLSEGTFMERIAPGAFRKTLAEHTPKVLFNHGKDPSVGDKVLGVPSELREDEEGGAYAVPLLDTSYNRDLVPGLLAGAYGSSFRFQVVREDYVTRTKASASNPDGLPERTIREARLFEFGPVTFPAYAGATAGVRSMTDEFAFAALTEDPARLRELVASVAPSTDAGAVPHLGQERRDPIPAPPAPKEMPTVADTNQYHTLDEMGARVRELTAEINRGAELPGILPDKEQEEFDAKVAERVALEAAMASWKTRLTQIRNAPEENQVAYQAPTILRTHSEADIYDLDAIDRLGSAEKRDQALRDNAMRAVESAPYIPTEGRNSAAYLLDNKDSVNKSLARRVLVTGSPQYRREWNRYVTTGERGTALAVGVDATGGFAVPFAFDPSIIATGAHTYVNPFRAACRVETIVGTDTWRGLTANAVTAAFDTEAAAATEQGPTFAQPEIIVKKAHAFVTYSIEMGQDRPDLGAELGVLINEAKDTLEEAEFAVGTGATVHPHGMLSPHATLLYSHVDCTTAHALVIADLDLVESSVPLRHRRNAAWFMGRATFRAIQGLETSGGRLFGGYNYPGVGGVTFGAPSGNMNAQLLGYPVYEVPSAATDLTQDDYFILCFGDPKSFVIVDRVGLSVEYIPTIFGAAQGNLPTGQRGLYAYWRTNSDTVNADAMRLLKVLNA